MSDPILPLLRWPEGIAQARIPANDNALRLEALVRPCLGVSNNPGSAADGDVWLVGSAPTGAFSTFDENDIALYHVDPDSSIGGWHAWAPVEELPLIVANVRKIYVGGSTSEWVDDPSIAGGGGGGGGTWGSITGTLSAQTDLQAALDAKAPLTAPFRSVSSSTTTVAGDANGFIFHPASDTTARTWTIDSNANVPYPVGTAITFDNDIGAGALTIAITSDTLVLVDAGATGSRTIAAGGRATALKVDTTRWRISGIGLT